MYAQLLGKPTITLAVFLVPAACSTAAGAADERPNVLFVIADDLNDSVDGMGGHPQARTPNIDRLAEQGVMFTNAHNPQPWCAPSRAALWSGLHPITSGYHGRGHWRQHSVLGKTVPVMEHFKRSGYAVYGTGKLFHNNHEDKSIYHEYKYDADFGPWPWDGKRRREHPDLALLFRTHFAKNLPRLHDAPHMQTFGPLSSVPRFDPDPESGIPGFQGWYLGKEAFRYSGQNDRDLTPDELSAQWAVEVLQRPHDRPFFLGVGFNRPHVPMYAPKKYFDLFPLNEIELPPYLSDDFRDCARALLDADHKGLQNFRLLHAAGGERMWKRWVQAYLANVAFVDDQLGGILDALQKSRHARNTIVVFTSDHGFHMGEKDWLFKNSLWEESTRVPLVIVAPEAAQPGGRCDHPVSLIDLYPTLIDLCGLPSNPNAGGNDYALDGHSVRPFLESPEDGTWDGPSAALTMLGQRHFSIRTRHWRYTLCNNGEEELYDHRNDPHEWHNLASSPQTDDTRKELREQLRKLTGMAKAAQNF
ncbi:MAG: sulfatase [Planctomycetota bacterium]|jgi:arylsulfatase A-like enzyme